MAQGALQELDETAYWLELLGDSGIVPSKKLTNLRQEANELISVFVTIVRKGKKSDECWLSGRSMSDYPYFHVSSSSLI